MTRSTKPKLRVSSFAISIDGYSVGPNQDLDNPLGVRGPELMEWFFQTRVWRKMHGMEGGETGVDNESGATIRQFLRAGLIDEMHLALRPVLLGEGEHLLHDIDLRALGYECWKSVAGERAMHLYLRIAPALSPLN